MQSKQCDYLNHSRNTPILIIGAGPSGIAAMYELSRHGKPVLLIEESERLGGIARTENYRGFLFDIGGHRFFTKNERIDFIWCRMLGNQFLTVNRISRIFYNGRYFSYPLKPMEVLRKFGLWESIRVVFSYLRSHVMIRKDPENLEEWMILKFGRRLYQRFFERYSEKVWGVSCHEIESDWASQRINGLSLTEVLLNFFRKIGVKSLIESFNYPVLGPQMMWKRFAEDSIAAGSKISMKCCAKTVFHDNRRVQSVSCNDNGESRLIPCDFLLSSIPIPHLIKGLQPSPPPPVREAARRLKFRAFIQVGLIVQIPNLFPDQWIYIHDPNLKVGRIQNFTNWSSAMVPDPSFSSLGMEYFCDINDELWRQSDDELVQLASREFEELGLGHAKQVADGFVVREPYAYPVYNKDYKKHIEVIRTYLSRFENLITMGRNGMHRYNNMDHAMLTGMLAAENVLGAKHDLWNVNEEKEYLEMQT
jgi:protoporphyrinogen oxidase